MPELETLIAAWRARLDREVADPEAARELESHLRDQIEALMRTGLAPAEAFAQAALRLGEPQPLARELARVHRWWRPESGPEWALLLLVVVFALWTCLLAARQASGLMALVMAIHVFTIVIGYVAVFSTGLIGACGLALLACRRPLDGPKRSKLGRVLFRFTLLAFVCVPVGSAGGMWWAARNLGRAWAWSPVETGAAFVFVSSLLLLLAQVRRIPANARYIVAVLGGVSMVAGWSWTRAVTGLLPISWFCAAFPLAQIAVLFVRSTDRTLTADSET